MLQVTGTMYPSELVRFTVAHTFEIILSDTATTTSNNVEFTLYIVKYVL